jgi:hypothetical protein
MGRPPARPNQASVPLDEAAIVAHLTGRHVMGVYPLLDQLEAYADDQQSLEVEDQRAAPQHHQMARARFRMTRSALFSPPGATSARDSTTRGSTRVHAPRRPPEEP